MEKAVAWAVEGLTFYQKGHWEPARKNFNDARLILLEADLPDFWKAQGLAAIQSGLPENLRHFDLEAVSKELARAIKHWDAEIEARDSLQRQETLFEDLPSLLEREHGLRSALEIITDQAKRLFQGCAASVLLKVAGENKLVVEFDKVSSFFRTFMATANQVELEGTDVMDFSGSVQLNEAARTGRYDDGLPEGVPQ